MSNLRMKRRSEEGDSEPLDSSEPFSSMSRSESPVKSKRLQHSKDSESSSGIQIRNTQSAMEVAAVPEDQDTDDKPSEHVGSSAQTSFNQGNEERKELASKSKVEEIQQNKKIRDNITSIRQSMKELSNALKAKRKAMYDKCAKDFEKNPDPALEKLLNKMHNHAHAPDSGLEGDIIEDPDLHETPEEPGDFYNTFRENMQKRSIENKEEFQKILSMLAYWNNVLP